MKRLLCIVSAMNAGGAETFLMKMYRKLDTSKYQMDFCVNIQEKGLYDEEIKELGGRIFYVPPKSQGTRVFKQELRKVIRDNQYKYVMRITSNAMGFWDLKIAKDAGAEVCIARSSNSGDAEGIIAKVAHYIGKILYANSIDVKIAPSDLAAIYTFGKKDFKNGDIHILHNALDLNVYKFMKTKRENIRNQFEIDEDTILVGHVGRFMAQKNHAFLLKIFNYFHKKHCKSKLLLVGDGELKDSIEMEVTMLGLRDSVIFTGVRSDIPDILSAMDIMLLPSLYEGMPNTVIEAQATGLPCVISSTITREADVTGLVRYVPIDKGVECWEKQMLELFGIKRNNTTHKMLDAGYSIDTEVLRFTEMVFEGK